MSELKPYRFCGGEAHHGNTIVETNGITVETNGKDDEITLLPCPFCGAEVEVLSDMHRTWGLVKHRDGCLFPNFRNHQISEYDFEAWNTRHVETDALREACRELVAYAGTCPFDAKSIDTANWSERCDRECSSDVDMAACWMRYFMEVKA